jgi:AraC-like DNA-binding protein
MYLEYEIEAPSDQRLIHELEVLLERHFKTQKRLEFYSDHLDVSLRRLNAICIYHLHKTLYELIQEWRFNESKKLLEHSTLSVKEITYYLGFCDPPYFIRYFKKQTGLTPRRYRMNLLEKWQEEILKE